MLKKIASSIQEWFTSHLNGPEKKQTNFLYCDCGHELIGNQKNPTSFIRDINIGDRNVVHYNCQSCKTDKFYDFNHFVPVPLPFSANDDIITKYYRYYNLSNSN